MYTVACALFFSEECAVSEELKIKLNIAYKRLLDEGCESKTGFTLSLKRSISGPLDKTGSPVIPKGHVVLPVTS